MIKKVRVPWNKGIFGYKTQPASEERKRKIGLVHKGKFVSKQTRLKISKARKGHTPWNKGKKGVGADQTGSKNHRWKGGKFVDKEGYILVKNRKHPFCNACGYVREHRLVIEKYIGRYLTPEEKTHHLGKKDDNRPYMLMAFINHSVHMKFEQRGKIKSSEIVFDGRNHPLL